MMVLKKFVLVGAEKGSYGRSRVQKDRCCLIISMPKEPRERDSKRGGNQFETCTVQWAAVLLPAGVACFVNFSSANCSSASNYSEWAGSMRRLINVAVPNRAIFIH